MDGDQIKSFQEYFLERKKADEIDIFENYAIQKAYFTGAYAKAVINNSWHSEVSKKNASLKNWLSGQIINYRNLDRIFEIAERYERKLRLNLKNEAEVKTLLLDVPLVTSRGLSSAKISFAFSAGFDDYRKFSKLNKDNKNNQPKE